MNIDDRLLHKLYLIISRVGHDKSTFYALTTRFLVKYMHGPNPQQGGHSSSRYMLQDIENFKASTHSHIVRNLLLAPIS
jgi:hypothetical protein